MANPSGNPNFAIIRNRDTSNATKARVAKADAFAKNMLNTLREHAAEIEDTTYEAKAEWLNSQGISTRLGRAWSKQEVQRLFIRLERIGRPKN
jgi:alcohol dehydrogenase YqhD (iron-dependent ADH family)